VSACGIFLDDFYYTTVMWLGSLGCIGNLERFFFEKITQNHKLQGLFP
jgi:hypothetical protein